MLSNLLKSHQRIIDLPIEPECFLTIVIPVRNEAQYLAKTLKSLTNQIDLNNRPIDFKKFEIIFLVNNTNDDSAQIIKDWCRRFPLPFIHFNEINLPPELSNIGYVRRWLMNEAYLRLRENKSNSGIIATTDGDTVVAPNWIAATISEIRKGADAVGGRICINPAELGFMNKRARILHLRDTGYRLMAAEIEALIDNMTFDGVPRHHQHFNGSFAVTTEAFEKAGGVPEVRFLEDVAFYKSLLRNDLRFRHSPAVRVQTSARLDGRTELGLSTQINEWTVMGQNGDSYFVESTAAILRRLENRRDLRDLWQNNQKYFSFGKNETKILSDKLLIREEYLTDELCNPQPFGSFYEKIVIEQEQIGDWQRNFPLISIEKAIFDLRIMLEKIRREKRIIQNTIEV